MENQSQKSFINNFEICEYMELLDAVMQILADQGISVLCVVYLMWFSATKLEKQNEIMAQMVATLTAINTRLDAIEDKVKAYHE